MTEARRRNSRRYDADCELCLAHKLTPWLYEDEECWVAECMICATPMIVWRPHGMPDEATEEPADGPSRRPSRTSSTRAKAGGRTATGATSRTTGTVTPVPPAGSSATASAGARRYASCALLHRCKLGVALGGRCA